MGCLNESNQANLKSISLAGLLAGKTNAVNDLVSACRENGFFYLDFRHQSTCSILEVVDDLAGVGNSVFKLPLEEKEKYSTEKHLPSRLLGYVLCVLLIFRVAVTLLVGLIRIISYKRVGCSIGPFAEKRDGYESFSVCLLHSHVEPSNPLHVWVERQSNFSAGRSIIMVFLVKML
jgi:isopenicillin N synthase-like dioxygenase